MTLDIQAARARAEAATPGPWTPVLWVDGDYDTPNGYDLGTEHAVALIADGSTEDAATADFIAHARTDLPAALDLLVQARDELLRVRHSAAGPDDIYHQLYLILSGEHVVDEPRDTDTHWANGLPRLLKPEAFDRILAEKAAGR